MVSKRDFILVFANGIIEELSHEPYQPRPGTWWPPTAEFAIPWRWAICPDVLIGDLDSLPEGVTDAPGELGHRGRPLLAGQG